MKYLVLAPEALIVATAVVLLLAGRAGWLPRPAPGIVPAVVAIVLVAFGLELWAGSVTTTYFGGAFVQDRFSLFAKAAVLLAAAIAPAATDWAAEDSASLALAMPLLGAFGVMVAASAGDVVGLWAGLELAGAAAVAVVALRRQDLAVRLLVAGGVASGLVLMGMAFLYATTGNADLTTIRSVLLDRQPTLALAIPIGLLLGGLAVRASLAPFHVAGLPAGLGASPLGSGVVLGTVAVAAGIVAVKLAAAMLPVPAVYTPFLEVAAAVAIVGGGAAAFAVRAPRTRLAYLAVGQVGWVAAGIATHYRTGVASAVFLLGAFAIGATCGPAVLGRAEGGEAAIAGLGRLRPARAAGLALAVLSLAGAPPFAGFFGELGVAGALGQSGNFVLLALAAVGSLLSLAAAVGTLGALYARSPLDDSRRGATSALPVLTPLATAGTVAFCLAIVAYGVFGFPIMALADQGAQALGLR